MRRFKILYVVESMERAGAEQVVLSMLSRLDRSRFEPIVCCLTERGVLAEQVEKLDIPVIALNKPRLLGFRVIFRLKKVIQENAIDIVNTHCWPSNVWGRVGAWLAKTPIVIATEHNVCAWKSSKHLLLDKWLSKITDVIICVSDAVKYFYADNAKIALSKLLTIHNGIDPKPFEITINREAKRSELGITNERYVVIVIGRLLPQKSHKYFLEAIAKIRKEHPQILGLIVGGGELSQELEAQRQQLNLEDHCWLLGERTDIPELLHIADLFALSSIREGLPLVALEAMASGKPAVVTEAGGSGEAVLNNVTGYVVPIADVNALQEKIVELILDPTKAQKMGERGRERMLSEFSLNSMVTANECVYQALLRKKRIITENQAPSHTTKSLYEEVLAS